MNNGLKKKTFEAVPTQLDVLKGKKLNTPESPFQGIKTAGSSLEIFQNIANVGNERIEFDYRIIGQELENLGYMDYGHFVQLLNPNAVVSLNQQAQELLEVASQLSSEKQSVFISLLKDCGWISEDFIMPAKTEEQPLEPETVIANSKKLQKAREEKKAGDREVGNQAAKDTYKNNPVIELFREVQKFQKKHAKTLEGLGISKQELSDAFSSTSTGGKKTSRARQKIKKALGPQGIAMFKKQNSDHKMILSLFTFLTAKIDG